MDTCGAECKIIIVSIFAAVDQSFSDAVAKAIGLPCAKPLKVKPASEAIHFRPNISLEQE